MSGTYSYFPSTLCPALPEKSAKIEIYQQSKLSVRAISADTQLCFRNQTDQEEETEGLERKRLEM